MKKSKIDPSKEFPSFKISPVSGFMLVMFIFQFSAHYLTAQDWIPVKPGEKYNYCYNSGIIHMTIWVDSTHIGTDDSTYYLNRIFVRDGYHLIKNSPVFLQRTIKFENDTIIFYSPDEYVLPMNLSVGDEWVFDTINAFNATLIDVYSDTILGQADSVRKISITNTMDSLFIIISKSHGIIKFPDFNDYGSYYYLVGMETEGLGMQMPMIRDFYDFHIGEIYFYDRNDSYMHQFSSDEYYTDTKYRITHVEETDSTLKYIKRGTWKQTYYGAYGGYDVSYGYVNSTITINFNADSWLNLYTNQAVSYSNTQYRPVHYDIAYSNTTSKELDESLWSGSGDTLSSSSNYSEEKRYAAGLGLVYYRDHDYVSYSVHEYLAGYEKEGTWYGNNVSDCGLLPPEVKNMMKIPLNSTTLTYNDTLVITLPSWFDRYEWSTGSTDNKITIISTDYEPGVYTFSVEIEYYYCIQYDAVYITIAYPEPEVSFSYEVENEIFYFTGISPHPEFIQSWDWDFGDGETSNLQNPVHTYSESGPFEVCLTITNIESVSATYCDTIQSTYNIQQHILSSSLEINYRPPGNIIVSNLSDQSYDYTLRIFDQTGRIISAERVIHLLSRSEGNHNINHLPRGFYFVRLTAGKETISKKIVH